MDEIRETRIFLVEDNPTDLAYFSRLLLNNEIEAENIFKADCIREAKRLFAESRDYGLVITDLTLPDSSGIETFHAIYKLANPIPIIVLSGIENEAVALEAVRSGASDYLVKRTTDQDKLRRAIRYTLARHKAEQKLRESEERFALAVRGSNHGVWDWQIDKDEFFVSERWNEIAGLSEENAVTSLDQWLDLIHPDFKELVTEKLRAHIDNFTSHFHTEYRMRHASGSWIWVDTRGLALRDENGTAIRITGSQSDISYRKSAEEQLIHNAFHDTLTGLANRALLHQKIDHCIRQFRRNKRRNFAVLFLDVDRFKHINDSFGHEYGDEVLKGIAKRLASEIRPTDTMARLGGDEFVILMEDIHAPVDALHLADRIHDQLAKPVGIRGEEYYTSVSIGIAFSSGNYQLPEQLIRDADTAMYRAKARGRSSSELFNKEMHEHAVQVLKLENDLRKAVEMNEISLQYQPIVNLRTGRISGFEALARWFHPVKGMIPPEKFIPVAEETGLINKIGWWIMKQACSQIRVWQEQFVSDPPLKISVNFSPRQFEVNDLVGKVLGILEETGLDPGSLILEITETVLIKDHGEHYDIVNELRSHGIHIHIDDFGMGYSSLSQIKGLTTDHLKIDRSFIKSMMESEEHAEIVKTIVSLACTLGMGSTAEGLETAAQLARARELNCDQGQGFFFSRPCDSDEIENLLSSTPGMIMYSVEAAVKE